ncbi:MAG: hypothetical protein ACKVOH_01050 [Chlamydiales bacterium]
MIYVFSSCLIAGIFFSQIFDLIPLHGLLTFLADVALSYIMMEVGLDFFLDKTQMRSHLKDYLVAF